MKHETSDAVNHPAHYQSANGECIDYAENESFCAGNCLKYLWRLGLKSYNIAEDCGKSRWYAKREIARLEGMDANGLPNRRATDFKPFEMAFNALWERLGAGTIETTCENWSDVLLLLDFVDAL